MARILIIDNESHRLRALTSVMEQDSPAVVHAASLEDARRTLTTNRYDAVITNATLPDGLALEVLNEARRADPQVPVILVTAADATVINAEGMRRGVFDILTEPFNPEKVRSVVQRACAHTTLQREISCLKATVRRLDETTEILSELLPLLGVREQVLQTASTTVPVLITGERGSGKELVARAIHQRGPCAGKPFRVVNCASLVSSLREKDLFEHDPESGDGASVLESAGEGTLFLDRVEELSLSTQERLTRLLSDAKSARLRSHHSDGSEVRILAATHQDLRAQVKQGLFRDDLYEALGAVSIALPPLRQHPSDIAALCELFLQQMAGDFNLPKRRLSVQALARLQAYNFPGNIRELKNLIERAVILVPDEQIGPEHFPVVEAASGSARAAIGNGDVADLSWVESLPPSFDLRNLLSTVEKTLIERTLQATRGAQAEAARRLGLSRSDLSYKLLKYELRKETPPAPRAKHSVVSRA